MTTTSIKMKIANVNWGDGGLTILLEDQNRYEGKPKAFTASEVLALVTKVEKFFAAEFVVESVEQNETPDPNVTKRVQSKPKDTQEELVKQLETEKAVAAEKQIELPIPLSEATKAIVYDLNAKAEEAVASINKDVEASGVTPAQQALNTILEQNKPAEEIAKDLHDAASLRAMAARESQSAIREPVKDTGQSLEELAREIAKESNPDLEVESEMALGVFTDEVNEITNLDQALDAAINVWTENKELFAKYPLIRDRARTILAGHVGTILGIPAPQASDMIKDRLLAKARPIVAPAASVSSQASAFLDRLAKDQKPVMGTAIKFACETVANEKKEVTAKLVEDFLVDLVGKHPALTSAQEIRDLVSSNRFKLFAAAAKTKVVE